MVTFSANIANMIKHVQEFQLHIKLLKDILQKQSSENYGNKVTKVKRFVWNTFQVINAMHCEKFPFFAEHSCTGSVTASALLH